MFKYIKTSLIAIAISLVFELLVYLSKMEVDFRLSLVSFIFHSLNLIIAIVLAVNYQNPTISRLDNLKKGILISIVFSLSISFYFFSYHKWINPEFLENKKQSLIELSENPETLRQAKENINSNPDFYNGKSAEDLVEMQQENINDLLKPGKVFPISLFSFLFLGMLSTLIISLLTHFFQKKN
ncbi:MAG: DUF4199 domain-containing protein [Flavobacteriales bacterium]|jgi:hypothetical protein|tara:strand:- start:6096 stop:6644 length:549 start_codon:yes stop_codon:yes gene_type:complete